MERFVWKCLAYGSFPLIVASMGFSSSSYVWYFGSINTTHSIYPSQSVS